MDKLDSMAVLLAAAQGGSLSAASRALGMPLATVSRKVSELEAHLRTKLVTRSSRKLSLTDAGQSYVAACKRIMEEIEEAERAAAGEYAAPRGDLTITTPVVFGRLHVLPVMTSFLRAYPEISARMIFADRVVNLFEEPMDGAVRIGPLEDSSLIAAKIGSIRRVVCGSPAYFAEKGKPEVPQDLAGHDCITFEGLMSPKSWAFQSGKAQLSVPIRSRLIVTSAEAAVDAAAAGLGVTRVLFYQIADALKTGKLVTVLEDFEPAPASVSLVYRGEGLLPQKLRAFLDFATPRLKARVASLGLP